MITFIDTEYVPGQDPWVKQHVTDGISAPANHKDPDKIAAYIEDKADAAYRKSCFNATLGELVCIAWAHDGGEVHSVSRQLAENEGVMLAAFFRMIQDTIPQDGFDRSEFSIDRSFKFCGHNLITDLRYIWRRAKINGIRIPFNLPINAKPWSDDIIDTMLMWKCDKYDSASASMDILCKVFGIDGKDGFDGSMVYDAMLAGEELKVAEYCRDDVSRTRQLFNILK